MLTNGYQDILSNLSKDFLGHEIACCTVFMYIYIDFRVKWDQVKFSGLLM